MKDILKVALGILTSIGGFLEVGAIATAATAGALYGYNLLWAIALGTICIVFLVEMSGRLAAVSHRALADAVRERFGSNFFIVPLICELVIDFLVIAAEIGGVSLALELVTGVPFRWWALPVGFAIWLLLWLGTFKIIEHSTALLGLVNICFVVAAFKLSPPLGDVARGLIPPAGADNPSAYWLLAVGILGAIISPYLLYFYSSGAIEDKWGRKDLNVNRAVAIIGMGFGSLLAMSILIDAAAVLKPAGIEVESFETLALILTNVFGKAGLYLFAASLGIACFGAAIESALSSAYVFSQTFGWNWGEDLKPKENARFATVYTVQIALASIFMTFGINPLKLTMFTMVVTAIILPIVIFPFLVIMNDERFLGKQRNGIISNAVALFTVVLVTIIAVVAIPLELMSD